MTDPDSPDLDSRFPDPPCLPSWSTNPTAFPSPSTPPPALLPPWPPSWNTTPTASPSPSPPPPASSPPQSPNHYFRALTTLISILRLPTHQAEITIHRAASRSDNLCELLSRTTDEVVTLSVRYQRVPCSPRPVVYICVSTPGTGDKEEISIHPLQQTWENNDANMKASYFFSHPSVSFIEHASELLRWLRAGISHDLSLREREDRTGVLTGYLMWRMEGIL
ncbi:hypothetical protein K440DRAFT_613429 [Wilcoxina mikolae CBS 423.85]|nr:hypothetical protein K440DRAFT_613429 [Wilcoxina mikolae CBS 423.85]